MTTVGRSSPASRTVSSPSAASPTTAIPSVLGTAADIEVAGAATTGGELLALAEHTAYDVEVVDPDAKVLILTMHDEPASIQPGMRAGTRGYVLKGAARARSCGWLLPHRYADAGQLAEASLDVERNDLTSGLPCVRSGPRSPWCTAAPRSSPRRPG